MSKEKTSRRLKQATIGAEITTANTTPIRKARRARRARKPKAQISNAE